MEAYAIKLAMLMSRFFIIRSNAYDPKTRRLNCCYFVFMGS
jgi:hypothetical protein